MTQNVFDALEGDSKTERSGASEERDTGGGGFVLSIAALIGLSALCSWSVLAQFAAGFVLLIGSVLLHGRAHEAIRVAMTLLGVAVLAFTCWSLYQGYQPI